jgi:hypothetical protein
MDVKRGRASQLTEGNTRTGRIESRIAWAIGNLDGLIGIAVAVVVGLLDIIPVKVNSGVTPAAILLVLASLVYGSLAERRRRVADMREATGESRRAIENLALVRRLDGRDEVEQALYRARQDTDRWMFKGGTGTYLRAVVLRECVQEARRQRRSLTVRIDIINPADERACAAYARFRGTFSRPDDGSPFDSWSTERTRKESYATVLAACWHRQRLDTLDISVHLSSVAPSLRFDLSSSCLIITQDDPSRVNLWVEQGQPLYDYYNTELHLHREQAVTPNLRDATPLADEPTVDEARRLFESLDLPLPTGFTDRDIGEIVEKALRSESPYRS